MATEISAQLVKQLRDRTGAGMMDAKKALVETDGDIEKAIDVLRTKGLAKAAKKGDRETFAGAVVVKVDGNKGVVVEVNSETDFVARNEKFQDFVRVVADKSFAANADITAVMTSDMNTELANQIATIGEKLDVRRMASVEVSDGAVISYVHNKLSDNIGLIGVLVAIEAPGADAAKIAEVGEQVAMHIAASSPAFLNTEDVDADTLEREKAVAREKAIAAGKPADIAEKMVAGNVKKYYDEVVLNEQPFFIEPAKKVKDFVATIAPGAKIVKFVRFVVGEKI